MFDPDVEDLIGSGPPAKPVPRQPKAKPVAEVGSGWEDPDHPEVQLIKTEDLQNLITGVSMPTLKAIFRKSQAFVDGALIGLRPVHIGKNGARYYDIAQAAERLVAPKAELDSFIEDMNPDDLPEKLRVAFWNAKLKRQEWEKESGFLWDTNDVMEVLEKNFMTIKTSTQQFMDTIEKKYGLTDEQRIGLQDLVADMMRKIRKDLDKVQKESETVPIAVKRS